MTKTQSTPVPLAWLHVIVACTFWHSCQWHNDNDWRKVNFFCKDCLHSMCQPCARQHKNFEDPHSVLQIRRYWYNDVVSVACIQMHINVTDIQTNNSNNEPVVHVKTKGSPSSHPGGKSKLQDDSIPCAVCSYRLKRPFRFCSIECKLKQWHSEKQETPPSNITSWVTSDAVSRTGALKIVIKSSLWKKQGKPSSAAPSQSQLVEKMASSQALACPSGLVEKTTSSQASMSPSGSLDDTVSSNSSATPAGTVENLKRGSDCSKHEDTSCSPLSGDANK